MKTIEKLKRRLLFAAVVLLGLSAVGATLRRRPAIQHPTDAASYLADENFAATLSRANGALARMASHLDGVAPQADNLTIARRISLALTGNGLSLEEIRALEAVPEEEQIEWWTSYLLEDHRWSDYIADRFSRAFVGTNDGPFLLFRRRKFNAWLSEQLYKGVGYDEIVRSMIASEGLWTDTPQVNFVTATMDDANNGRGDPIRLAGRTARAFLAQRIDCVQCHDDFLGSLNFGPSDDPVSGMQSHFHELAAFYSGTALPEAVFQGIREDNKAYEYRYLGAESDVVVQPQVPFATDLLPKEGKPRSRLAAWVTHPENQAFSRAAVNRMWALMFSKPLVDPVDNIPIHSTVPEVLDVLADDFAAQGFDTRRLIRLIVSTDAFRRDSRAEFELTLEYEQAWAAFPITQLRPEQVAGSMFQACQLSAIDDTSSIITRLKTFGDSQNFLRGFGDRGEDEFDSDAVTIPQRLIMMNGNLVTERTKADFVANACSRIAALVSDDQEAVEIAFLCVLNRHPSKTEQEAFVEYLAEKKGRTRHQAFGDIFWAMLNSTEFSWNH